MCDSRAVVVAGAGIAGATVAAGLASRGVPVVVVDTQPNPGSAGAEVLAPGVHHVLAELGLTARAAAFPPARVSVMDWGNGEPAWRQALADDAHFPFGYHVDHDAFVALLLTRAQECGATVRRDTHVLGPIRDADGVVSGIEVRDGQGTRALPAAFVVDATGPARAVSSSLSEADPIGEPYRLDRSHEPPGHVPGEHHVRKLPDPGQWQCAVPRADGTSTATLRPHRHVDVAAERWAAYRCPALVGAGWLSVGDAAGRQDPMFLDPATITLLAAQAAVPVVADLAFGSAAQDAPRIAANYHDCYTGVLDAAGEFARFCLDPARQREGTERLAYGLSELVGTAGSGAVLSRTMRAVAGHTSLFDVHCPEGPLIASLQVR